VSVAALVMAAAPRPGEVLKGLEPLLGPDGCAALQARLIARAARVAAAVAPAGAAYVAVDPPDAAPLLADLVGSGVELVGQPGGDPGERLALAVGRVFETRPGPLLAFGTSAPALGSRHVGEALDVLRGGRDAAIGPTLDGGYYLIALARPLPELFALPAGSWGGDEVLGLTLRAARAAGHRAGLIEPARALATPADAAALLEDGDLDEAIAALLRVPERP
jgi:glycosyltransferase A (GT-A) superfamily protein (DUF2064 family)